MLGGPERINAEPAHSQITVLVVRSGRSISCIGSRVRDRFTIRSASGSPARPCLGPAPRLRYFALAFFLRENRYAHPRARPWSALVRWTGSGVRYARTPVSLRVYDALRVPGSGAGGPPDPRQTGAQPWRGPGCWAQSPKPKARSEAPMHPSPPNFNAGTRGHGKRNNRAFPLPFLIEKTSRSCAKNETGKLVRRYRMRLNTLGE